MNLQENEAEIKLRFLFFFSVLRLGFEPVIYYLIFYYACINIDGSSRVQMDKAILMEIKHGKCLGCLIKYRNISCIVLDDVSERKIGETGYKCGEAAMKIIPEYLTVTVSGLPMKFASPYQKCFDELL